MEDDRDEGREFLPLIVLILNRARMLPMKKIHRFIQ